MSHSLNRPFIPFALTLLLAVIALWGLLNWSVSKNASPEGDSERPVRRGPVSEDRKSEAVTASAPPPENPSQPAVTPSHPLASGKSFDSFRLRPFPVAKETASHSWTAEDGRSLEAIRNLAHNEAEVARLTEENGRIKRRQLVYRKEPAFSQVQRARTAGEQVRKLLLPGLDGEEHEVEITAADLGPAGMKGTFTGQLPGRLQSLVTLAFKEGREAFTVLSPEDGIYLQAHPREPGELLITTFDPDIYLPLPGGEPIKTQ